MEKIHIIIIAVIAVIFMFLLATIHSPVLVIAEDTEEYGGVDMAAEFSIREFSWVYPGSSVNEYGQTMHNVHADHPEDPYGAIKNIMEYTYNESPFVIISVNNFAAQTIFGGSIVDDIRANDGYFGYSGNSNVQGTMSRGDAVGVAMLQNGINVPMVPIQILLGNIQFHFV